MRKWLLGLCLLLFLDTQTAGHLREKTSLQDLRDRGIPTRMLERLEIPAEEIRLYGIFWEDLQYFPAAGRKEVQGQQFFFENSWHARRTFQGERLHEGCDIFGREEKSGYYPILSMTDGIVENGCLWADTESASEVPEAVISTTLICLLMRGNFRQGSR